MFTRPDLVEPFLHVIKYTVNLVVLIHPSLTFLPLLPSTRKVISNLFAVMKSLENSSET